MYKEGILLFYRYIEHTPARVKKNNTLYEYLFICFVALLIQIKLDRKINEKGLNKKHSIESILLYHGKNRHLSLEKREQIVMERN